MEVQQQAGEMVQVQASGQEFVDGVATQDVQLNDDVWVRIFLPQLRSSVAAAPAAAPSSPPPPMPLVLYAHGGSYSTGQPHHPRYHSFCASMSKLSLSVWVSLSYRLAPAHRLPAPYVDAALALSWLLSQAHQQQPSHPWLSTDVVDFSNVFLAGESAGANIALKLAMDGIISESVQAPLICIRGLLLIQPGFHSEAKRAVMTNAHFYDKALPEGETLDYHLVNPMHAAAPPLTPLSKCPHILVIAAEKDCRYDMTMSFYAIARDICPHVELVVTPGKGHVFHLEDPLCAEAQDLCKQLAGFMQASACKGDHGREDMESNKALATNQREITSISIEAAAC